jgi:hypothetical protein
MNSGQNIKLSPGLRYTLQSMPRGKDYKNLITHSCNITSYHITIDSDLNCILCGCDGWLPIPVGKIFDFNSLEDVWNSPAAKMLQDDINQKKFTWCAVEHCGVIHNDIIQKKYSISILIDDSCNLACPSCRREIRMLDSGPEFENKIKILNHIMNLIEKFNHPIEIFLGGSGDALASHIVRFMIKNYHPKIGQLFGIATNGLLIKKLIPDSPIRDYINRFGISVDAASAKVYEQVRRPGKWKVLLENLEWLSNNRGSSKVNLTFTVQKTNFKDIPAFAELCQQLNFQGSLQPLNDWGTWNSAPVKNPDSYTIINGTYLDHNVADPNHPEYLEFLTVLQNVSEKNKNLTISPYLKNLNDPR